MSRQTHPTDTERPAEPVAPTTSGVPRAATAAVWSLFALSLCAFALATWGEYEWTDAGVVAFDGLTALVWVVVTFFSAIVHSYSRRYMAGEPRVDRFFVRIFAFTLVVMTMIAADHVALFTAAWLGMGLLMASLIGHVRDWPQARAAARTARRHFVASTALLAVGLAVLAWSTGETAITGILADLESVSRAAALAAVGCLVLAAVVQSALFPFHTWLLSSMTAPTPASALMHAGFVNAGGVLLTKFAPLLTLEPAAMAAVVAVGAVSALLGQALLLVQTDVKRELGASTIAQMGFMVLQCGLGFFAAAIAHLVLHGFYKAYCFLSSGSAVERTAPAGASGDRPDLATAGAGLVLAIAGGVLFATLTGKGTAPDSGLLLTLVIVITTLDASRDLLRRSTLSAAARLAAAPVVVLTAITVYAVLYNAISTVLKGSYVVAAPTDLTVVHVAVAALFVASYAATELGWHRDSERLYVALVNLSQPDPDTILTRTEEYNDA